MACGTAAPGQVSGDAPAWWGPPFIQQPGKREFTGRLIVRPHQGLDGPEAALKDAEARAQATRFVHEHVPEVDEYFIVVPPGYTEDSLAAELLETGLYEWVRPDWMLFPLQARDVIPDDPFFPGQWNLAKIRAPSAWDITREQPNVVIAVVDTGVDFTHPDLADNMVLGYCSFILERRAQTPGPPWNTVVMDSHGHGTGIAGVVAAVGNNGLGISGVGWDLSVMPIRASSSTNSGASFGDIQNGALWATNNGARVVSVSYTGVEDPGIDTLGAVLRSRNALLVWAMDDNGWNTDLTFPFDHPNVTVVSGTGMQDQRWVSSVNPHVGSSYGTGVDIAAPAAGIWLTTIGGGYGTNEGNSYSAPTCAAALGMIWSVAPGLLAHEVEQVLLASADDIGPPGEDVEFGVGRLNLRRALWNAVVRQHAMALPSGPYNAEAFGVDDAYEFELRPMDVTGDRAVDEKDVRAVRAYIRRNEAKDMAHLRR
jgi:thermitase